MTIKLVTFDLDGTLWPIDEVLVKANQEMHNWIRPIVPAFVDLGEDQMTEIRSGVLESQPEIAHDISAVRIEILKAAFERLGLTPSRSSELANGAFEVLLSWRNRVVPFAGVRQVLDQLQDHYTLASLTNGNADVSVTPLKDCFSFNLSAASVGALKPDPKMFKLALDLADVEAHEAVHVGDHPVDDIEAANAVGMQTIWVDYQESETAANATATVRRFEDLPKLLRDL